MKKYFSQYRQDEFIDKVVFNKKHNGFFVDIGAHDGISFSNSYFFEVNRAYNGLCIEPNPKVFDQLKKNRKCDVLNACIADKEGTSKFLVIEGYAEMLSGIADNFHPEHIDRIDSHIREHGGTKQEIEVNCTPLQNIKMLNIKVIDFVSIDTEGNELNILKSIDFNKIKIACFTIENNYGDTTIEEIMRQNNYIKVYRLGVDDFYILRSEYNFGFRIRRAIFHFWTKLKK